MLDLSIPAQSLVERHPLDRKYRCGFDPHGVTNKRYREHIAGCTHPDCVERQERWRQLVREFSDAALRRLAESA